MKKILITGANSYIGVSFENYIKTSCPDKYTVDTVDMIDGTWRDMDFSGYDTVFHVAGIAHQKETKENADLYYKVNRDLAIETAKKAKSDGVKQFIFLSSMSIYGMDTGVITKDTAPNPKSNYGKSKYQAETEITKLQDNQFKVAVLRPPMVYGKGCKGNFQTVIKFVKLFPAFPKIKNERSMIYIDNLCSFVKMCLDKELSGIYFPQNSEFVSTIQIAKTAAVVLHKKRFYSVILGCVVFLAKPFFSIIKKAFGSLKYVDTDDFDNSYCVVDTIKSIELSIQTI